MAAPKPSQRVQLWLCRYCALLACSVLRSFGRENYACELRSIRCISHIQSTRFEQHPCWPRREHAILEASRCLSAHAGADLTIRFQQRAAAGSRTIRSRRIHAEADETVWFCRRPCHHFYCYFHHDHQHRRRRVVVVVLVVVVVVVVVIVVVSTDIAVIVMVMVIVIMVVIIVVIIIVIAIVIFIVIVIFASSSLCSSSSAASSSSSSFPWSYSMNSLRLLCVASTALTTTITGDNSKQQSATSIMIASLT